MQEFSEALVKKTKRFRNLKDEVDDIKNHRFFEHFSWKNLLLNKLDTPYVPKLEPYAFNTLKS